MPAKLATPGKGRQSTVGNDVDSIMPLLFATIGNPSMNFKKMAAMDSEGRAESSLEHKFRKWRQMGREIAEKFPEHAGPVTERTPKKPRALPIKKAANGKGKQSGGGDEDNGNGGGVSIGGTEHHDGSGNGAVISTFLAIF